MVINYRFWLLKDDLLISLLRKIYDIICLCPYKDKTSRFEI